MLAQSTHNDRKTVLSLKAQLYREQLIVLLRFVEQISTIFTDHESFPLSYFSPGGETSGTRTDVDN